MTSSLTKYLHILLIALAVLSCAAVRAAEPTLELNIAGTTQHLRRSELLANPALRTIQIAGDAAYHRKMRFRALPVSALLADVAKIGSLQFTAIDGFVANIPGPLLAGPGQAWLAIEPANDRWPPLQAGGVSAGPFYLVWRSPEKAGVSGEQWPYQIVRISDALPLERRYPQILPKTAANGPEQRGLQVYIENCATCHQINGGGDAAIGPDLNQPGNPTEYFQASYFRKFVRNPASLRNWKQRIMPGFAADALSDAKLDDLMAYLRQMAMQREVPAIR